MNKEDLELISKLIKRIEITVKEIIDYYFEKKNEHS
jgi:hypothetical protein